jgi:hypothetical protein
MCVLEEEKPESLEKVGGGRSTQPPGHVVPNRPLEVGGGPIHPYKYPLMVKVDTPHSFYSPPLVKVPV